jgi:hypothetical protein
LIEQTGEINEKLSEAGNEYIKSLQTIEQAKQAFFDKDLFGRDVFTIIANNEFFDYLKESLVLEQIVMDVWRSEAKIEADFYENSLMYKIVF